MTAAELVAESERLREGVGEEPEAEVWSPELAGWFDRCRAAADTLVELAQGDAQLLRSAAGPVIEVGRRSGPSQLLILAAIKAERQATSGNSPP